MPLTKNEPVAPSPFRLRRPKPQNMVVENSDHLHQRQRWPNMPSAAHLDGPKNETAQIPTALIQRLTLHALEVGLVGRTEKLTIVSSHLPSHGTKSSALP